MSEWKEFRLCEVTDYINRGVTPYYSNFGVIVINQKCVRDGQIKYEQSRFTNPEKKKIPPEKLLQSYDILINSTGQGTLGRVGQVKSISTPTTVDSHLTIVRANKSIDPIYLGYVLKSKQKIIEDLAEGTTGQTELSRHKVADISLLMPGLKKQKIISEVLSSLDDKIELNNKINQQLESLAQLLFKRWFVDFEFPNENGEPYKSSGGEMAESELGEIPKGWKLDKLEKIVTKSHTGADAITRAPIVDYDTGIKCARVGDLTNKRSYLNWAFCKINPQDYERHKLEEGDIIVTRTATLGVNQLVRKSIDAVCNNGLIRLKLDKKVCHPNFVFIQLQSDTYKEYIERISGDSSTRPNMQMDYLLDFKIILPESSLVIKFSELLEDIYNQIDACMEENKVLANTRDTLLPILISGELQIKEN